MASWQEHPPPLNFGLSENLLVRNFSLKNTNFEAEKLIWGKFRVKIEFLSTHGLLCRTFAAQQLSVEIL